MGAGGTYFVAVDPSSGIVACGRSTRAMAQEDARALNAAHAMGYRQAINAMKEQLLERSEA